MMLQGRWGSEERGTGRSQPSTVQKIEELGERPWGQPSRNTSLSVQPRAQLMRGFSHQWLVVFSDNCSPTPSH